jgi:ubiquinone/menaquinone biosynthesis C-methylase UbiE
MKDYSLKSGERYSSLDLNLIGGDHLWRYRYVVSRLKDSRKRLFGVDIFCGSGYGSKLVATELDVSLLAIDGSQEAILQASEKIHNPNILWTSKVFPFDLPDESFDFVMSMESIEHVRDFDTFFWLLTKSLKKGGTLFLSCPNESVTPYSGYQWHFRHFVPQEMRALAFKCNMLEVNAFSTLAHGLKGRKTVIFYPFQINNELPLSLEDGDTMFFEFQKL